MTSPKNSWINFNEYILTNINYYVFSLELYDTSLRGAPLKLMRITIKILNTKCEISLLINNECMYIIIIRIIHNTTQIQ